MGVKVILKNSNERIFEKANYWNFDVSGVLRIYGDDNIRNVYTFSTGLNDPNSFSIYDEKVNSNKLITKFITDDVERVEPV